MGFRFQRRIKIAPGLTINLSKSGVSASVGPRGLKYTVGTSGRERVTVGVPGTGVSYTTTRKLGARKDSAAHDQQSNEEAPAATQSTDHVFVFVVIALIVLILVMAVH